MHSTMLTFYMVTSDGGGIVCSPAFTHIVIVEGVNGGEVGGSISFLNVKSSIIPKRYHSKNK